MSNGYRYGFNGKENDRDWGGDLIQDYGFRMYNPRVGRFLSVDPLTEEYPWYTPYQFAGNEPIANTDRDGEEPQRAVAAAAVEYGSQVLGNLWTNWDDAEFSLDFDKKVAYDEVDFSDVGTAAAEGLIPLPKGALKGVVSGVRDFLVEYSQEKVNFKPSEGLEVNEDAAVGAVRNLAATQFLDAKLTKGSTANVKKTSEAARKANNIADNGRKRTSQVTRAKNADDVAKSAVSHNKAVRYAEKVKEAIVDNKATNLLPQKAKDAVGHTVDESYKKATETLAEKGHEAVNSVYESVKEVSDESGKVTGFTKVYEDGTTRTFDLQPDGTFQYRSEKNNAKIKRNNN